VEYALAGITRESIIHLLENEYSEKIIEKPVCFDNLVELYKNKKIRSMFSTGTAVGFQPIASITHEGKRMSFSINTGLQKKLRKRLLGIQSDQSKDDYGWMVPIHELYG